MAKDLGTGNEQKVTITASTNLSDDDIKKAVQEAEKFAAEDKARKEEVEIRNQADTLIYQTEKQLADLGDKIEADDKAKIDGALNELKEKVKGTDNEAIKASTEELTKVFYEISSKLYQQTGAEGAPGAEGFDPNMAQGDPGNQGNNGNDGNDGENVNPNYKVD